jgi:hypothetical protein
LTNDDFCRADIRVITPHYKLGATVDKAVLGVQLEADASCLPYDRLD